ncbi:MAG: galactose mutarotase [Holophagales bacterium]|nr:galactose mutarotase [Holophagales bacterium]MYD23531.1 galactose mutarotase [Holophagales bacterium]MYI31401.1 galactose mutarotase [Holophagales bacterium]
MPEEMAALLEIVQVTRRPWGEVDGREVEIFRLASQTGLQAEIAELGGAIVSLTAQGRDGEFADVVLGFDDLASYLADTNPYFGVVVGRYANRIAGGRFTLDGETYVLPRNDGKNSLHGGIRGLSRVVWEGEPFEDRNGAGVVLRYRSPDGEEGYPGNVDFQVRYLLTSAGDFRIEAEAVTDEPTVVNLSFHSYFNLQGEGEGDILDHELLLNSEQYTPVNDTLIPTGEIASTEGTPMDFRTAALIGDRIDNDFEQLRFGGGYDHNWVLRPAEKEGEMRMAAIVVEPTSGRKLVVRTTAPGLQLYTGNFLDGTLVGKSGRPYVHRGGLCLETQHFPDAPNQPTFPSTVLRPGETYRQVTEYQFYTDSVRRQDR